MEARMIIIVAITGATGSIYGIRLLETLSKIKDMQTHLVISEAGEVTIKHETGRTIKEIRKLADYCYEIDDIGARISSGSFQRDAMIIAPCTVKTMSGLAHSYNENLIIRAGDVTLKERKKLLLVFRETPYHIGHLRSMAQLTEMGAIIMPPVPAFYHKPKTVNDIVDYTVGKMLDILSIKHNLYKAWQGIGKEGEPIC